MLREDPLDRLNYYNGQRLEATDFRLEQAFHMRVQRWLNKSMFSAGVADGLEIERIADDRIVVHPGLALDDLGREIILLEPQELQVEAPYLTIRYNEEKIARTEEECAVPPGTNSSQSKVTWGGPSLIRAEPILAWRTRVPENDQRELVIALFELDRFCKIQKVLSGPFRFATVSSISRVRTYALQGELDIDKSNSGRVYFHIRGRRPEAVTLYLRAAKFSTLYYTEMGKHKHGLTVGQNISTSDPILDEAHHTYEHSHKNLLEQLTTDLDHQANGDLGHSHRFFKSQLIQVPDSGEMLNANNEFGIFVGHSFKTFRDGSIVQEIFNDIRGEVFGGEHSHKITGSTDPETPDFYHTHTFSPTVSMADVGISDRDPGVRDGKPPLTYFSNLQIWIDGNPYTSQILDQIKAQYNGDPNDWNSLSANASHPFVTGGTRAIRLDFLLNPPLNLNEEEHQIEFRINDEDVGGRLYYNLYVE